MLLNEACFFFASRFIKQWKKDQKLKRKKNNDKLNFALFLFFTKTASHRKRKRGYCWVGVMRGGKRWATFVLHSNYWLNLLFAFDLHAFRTTFMLNCLQKEAPKYGGKLLLLWVSKHKIIEPEVVVWWTIVVIELR